MFAEKDWTLFLALAISIGSLAGIIGSLLPEAFFYETGLYYWEDLETPYKIGTLIKILWGSKDDFTWFLKIRFFIPAVFLIIGATRKKVFLLQFYILFELAAISFQAVLIFGAIGIEGWFRYQLSIILSECCYLLAAFQTYFLKKRIVLKTLAIRLVLIRVFQILILLLCGMVLEILQYG